MVLSVPSLFFCWVCSDKGGSTTSQVIFLGPESEISQPTTADDFLFLPSTSHLLRIHPASTRGTHTNYLYPLMLRYMVLASFRDKEHVSNASVWAFSSMVGLSLWESCARTTFVASGRVDSFRIRCARSWPYMCTIEKPHPFELPKYCLPHETHYSVFRSALGDLHSSGHACPSSLELLVWSRIATQFCQLTTLPYQ